MDEHGACGGPPSVPPELADSLGWLLARAGQAVGGTLAPVLAAHGVTPRELSVLQAAEPQPRPQLGLAAAVGLDKTTMVATVDALERRGLVRREGDPRDRRLRLVAVTDDGRELLARARAGAEQVEASFAGREDLLPLLRELVRRAAPASGSCH